MFFNVCLHLHSFPRHAYGRKSDVLVDKEPQGNWRWDSNSRDVVAISPSSSSPATERSGELDCRLIMIC